MIRNLSDFGQPSFHARIDPERERYPVKMNFFILSQEKHVDREMRLSSFYQFYARIENAFLFLLFPISFYTISLREVILHGFFD